MSERSSSASKELKLALTALGWDFIHSIQLPSRKGESVQPYGIGLSTRTEDYLRERFPNGIYAHQKHAIEAFLAGQNVCLTTGTASGKTLCFHVAAIEKLEEHPSSRVIATYPLKALAREQEERWNMALQVAGLPVKVGRIDGQVPMNTRIKILRNCHVLLMTPDIVHAWLLRNIASSTVAGFLKNVSLLIVDEIHNYSGVFGSNAAYLYRRLRHVMGILGANPQCIGASATISNPEAHLRKLLGMEFRVIGADMDTSPRESLAIHLANPPDSKDLLSALAELMSFVARETERKSIAFVDSRKQTEYIASIVSRQETEPANDLEPNLEHIRRLGILPYRAGYEERDRMEIQQRLSTGSLRGVVSTSALELGIDVPHLTLGVLVGVPHSATSFYQRIGRIARHSEGDVIIVNDGSIYSESIFRRPDQLMKMPLSESALYLGNKRIQYIHALCLARHGGEHDQVCGESSRTESSEFESPIEWPDGFLELCRSERIGVIPPELQTMKAQAGDDPNHIFPLRDIDVQFRVENRRGPLNRGLGSLSQDQLMREAYPGAVYYYTTKPFRVYRVRVHTRVVEVRHEKAYHTKPIMLPSLIFPNLSPGNIFTAKVCGKLVAIECNLQIRESIVGFKERRGPNEFSVSYPLDSTLGLYFDQPRFTRNYFTTGVILSHPSLNEPTAKLPIISNLLFEAFLMTIPFERGDLHFGSDRFRSEHRLIQMDNRFAAIYDKTYGSLRLSSRLVEGGILAEVVGKAVELARYETDPNTTEGVIDVLEHLHDCLAQHDLVDVQLDLAQHTPREHHEKVIAPGSKGLDLEQNEEFWVEALVYTPQGLMYRGRHLSEKSATCKEIDYFVAHDLLAEIPGESTLALYDYNTGRIEKIG